MFSSPAPEGGYNGDDDQGQLGALSALMAIGLFDLQGGVGENPDWEITAPIFDRVRIDLASGKRLAIHVTRGAPGDGFIQSLKFNGKRLTGVFLSSAELMQGGTLEISLGAEPVR
jgi:putative alpha-1,2-mannosidase